MELLEEIELPPEVKAVIEEIRRVEDFLYSKKMPCKVDSYRDYITVKITKGHWKNDHIRCDELMRKLGYSCITFSFDDASANGDIYTATRYYRKEQK